MCALNSQDQGEQDILLCAFAFLTLFVWLGIHYYARCSAEAILVRRASNKFDFTLLLRVSVMCIALALIGLRVGRAVRKYLFGHIQTAKALISLRGGAAWSGPSLSANRIIGWRAKARMIFCACAEWCESAHFCACSKALFRLAWSM